MSLKVINFDGDLIQGVDTRNEFSKVIGNGGYGVFGSIQQDSQYIDRANIGEDVCFFVKGLFVQNVSEEQIEVPNGSYIVVETSYTGEGFKCVLKAVSQIDTSLVNGIMKHFPVYENSPVYVGMLNRGGNVTERITLPAIAWSSVAPYTLTKDIRSVRENSKILPDLILATNTDTRKEQRKAYGLISEGKPNDGSITFICDEKKPDIDLNLILLILGGN